MSQWEKRGWAWPLCSRKAHYFLPGEAISLCGKVMFTGGEREDDHHHSKDNCAECVKRRDKQEKRGTP
jgi:hypothetical protein